MQLIGKSLDPNVVMGVVVPIPFCPHEREHRPGGLLDARLSVPQRKAPRKRRPK